MIIDLFQKSSPKSNDKIDCLFDAAESVLGLLSGKVSVSPKALQEIMTRAFGGSDASGAWQWKDAYEVLEIAQLRFLQKYSDTLRRMKPEMALTLLDNLQSLCPTHTKRSEESQAMQQFSTPVAIGYIASIAAQMTAGDVMLEPSAGTGLLAVMGRLRGGELILNELAEDRGVILARLFPHAPLSSHNAEYLADYLDASLTPSVVLMNPPFSASPNAACTHSGVTMQHVLSALRLITEGGRLVAITGEGFSPFASKWRPAFVALQKEATVCFSAGIAGKLYAKHGTTAPTRLTVIDRVPASDPETFTNYHETAETLPALLGLVQAHVPARINAPIAVMAVSAAAAHVSTAVTATASVAPAIAATPVGKEEERLAVELEYLTRDWLGGETTIGEGLYESYEPQTIEIAGAHPHPSPLVQSAAMASIAGPKPQYRPHIYRNVLTEGILSAAQLESLIYAGEAHSQFLKGHFKVDEESGIVSRVATAARSVHGDCGGHGHAALGRLHPASQWPHRCFCRHSCPHCHRTWIARIDTHHDHGGSAAHLAGRRQAWALHQLRALSRDHRLHFRHRGRHRHAGAQ
jgi:predicted RNA methylase